MTTTPAPTPTWVPHHRSPGWTCEPAPSEVRAFHRALDGYRPTPLLDLPELARELGVGKVLAKDESDRLGLPAFKALGASWAVHRAVADFADGTILTVVAATDGNHGRAVARFARLLGHDAAIYIPTGLHPAAVQAIIEEGARLTVVDGSYDDAVAAAAREAEAPFHVLVQDTAWKGYEDIPRLDRRRVRHAVRRDRRSTTRKRCVTARSLRRPDRRRLAPPSSPNPLPRPHRRGRHSSRLG